MQRWHIGNTTITRIEELIGPLFDPVRFFPDFDPDVFKHHAEWLYPDQVDATTGNLISSMHSWLIETEHHTILVDTCIGDDKDRMPYRNWHQMHTPWLDNLRRAGVNPEDVDFVMCTHLHVDHVGWNTRLQNGQWVPTFPNARYLFSRTELEFWQHERDAGSGETFSAVNNKTFDDSVLPVIDQTRLVDGELELVEGQIRLMPAPGHTPGSMTLALASQGDSALFTGDICHHPIQVYLPHWNSAYCELPDVAIETRKHILADCADRHTLMMPAHFGSPHAGYVTGTSSGFGFEFTSPTEVAH
jgi:glyoxylase-like metal-dependent hydrolase (beta-lactamase superfamily II)